MELTFGGNGMLKRLIKRREVLGVDHLPPLLRV
jgi:hypothetical protein